MIIYCFIVFTLPVQIGDNLSIDRLNPVLNQLNSPQKIVKFLSDFDYEYDRTSGGVPVEVKIKPPYMFLQDQKGDCKDFGNFACRVATVNNIPNRLYALYPIPTNIGHAFSVWKYEGFYYPICNIVAHRKIPLRFSKLSEIRSFYKDNLKWEKITDFQSMVATPFLLVPIPEFYDF